MNILQSGGKGFVSEINVTPFVDVMLVLLIIFMVTAPLMAEGLDVNLGKAESVKVLPTEVDNLILTIKRDGKMLLGDVSITLDNLDAVLKETVTAQRKQLFLQADKDVPYGIVVEVMGKARSAGIEKLGVVAESAETATTPKKP